jgi:neutral amino acid transport system substrate-binding protein
MNQSDAQKNRKLWFVLGAIVSAGVVAGACQQLPSTTIKNSDPNSLSQSAAADQSSRGLRLGALLPASGNLGSTRRNMLESLPIFMGVVNNCGGVNGVPISLAVADDQATPKDAAAAMAELIDRDKVTAVVGAFASNASTAALETAAQHKVLMISPASTSPLLTERAKQGRSKGFWARTVPSDINEAAALAKLAKDRGYLNVATVVVNNEEGIRFEQTFVKAFEKLGGKVLGKAEPVRYDPQATQLDLEAAIAFSPEGQKPDAVVAILSPQSGDLLLKSAYEQGLTEGVQILLTNAVQSEQFIQDVGRRVNGKFILLGAIGTAFSANGPAFSDFTKLWQEKTDSVTDAFVPPTWDAASLIVLAAQAATSNQGEQIKAKLRDVANPPGQTVTDVCQGLKLLREGKEINYEGASGKVDIDKNGDVLGNYDVWTVDEQGKIRTIDLLPLE